MRPLRVRALPHLAFRSLSILAVAALCASASAGPEDERGKPGFPIKFPPIPCSVVPFAGGTADGFATGPVEPATVGTELATAVGGSFVPFDHPSADVHFAHRIVLPSGGCVTGAKLEFRARPIANSGSANDAISLGFADATPGSWARWGAWFGKGNSPASATLRPSSTWTSPSPFPAAGELFTLDLALLPRPAGTIDIVTELDARRFLDVYVQDDTSVDYVRLDVTLCKCVPEMVCIPIERVLVAGSQDGYAGGIDAASPSASLQALTGGGAYVGFDAPSTDRKFGHTFALPKSGCGIVGATLEVGLKSLGQVFSNDSLTLGVAPSNVWVQRWDTTVYGGGLLGSSTSGVVTLNLASLAGGVNLLPAMSAHRELDLYLQDDTAIDYAKLTVTVCICRRQLALEPASKVEMCVFKFDDANGNGVRDSGEAALAGWTFVVRDLAGNVVANPTTGPAGGMCFVVPAPAVYQVFEVPQAGWTQTLPAATGPLIVTANPGPVVNVTFGNRKGGGGLPPGVEPVDPSGPSDPR